MRKLCTVLTLWVVVGAAFPVAGKTPYVPDEALKAEVRRGFEEILDLWRDGKFADVYERTIAGGKLTKEQFTDRLAAAPRRPACCWEKLQDVKITPKGDSVAVIRAKVGFEEGTGTGFKSKSWKLVKEEGVWRLSQTDLLSMAGATKKKGIRHTKIW